MKAGDLRFRILTVLGLPVAGLSASDCKKERVAPPDAGQAAPPPTTATPVFRSGEPASAEARRAMEAALGPAPAPTPTCGKDQIPEILCGFASAPQTTRLPEADAGSRRADAGKAVLTPPAFANCGASGDALDASGELSWGETLEATVASQRPSWKANDPSHATFTLDPAKTHAHRISVAGTRARVEVEQPPVVAARYAALSPDKACCYTRCRPLEVATPTRTAKPAGWVLRNVCFDAPPGGTGLPAPGDPACPAGVALGVGPSGDVAPAVDSTAVRTPTGGRKCCYATLRPVPTCLDEPHHAECTGPRPQHAKGRPIREDGVAIVAATAASLHSVGWHDAPTSGAPLAHPDDGLTTALRQTLASAWAGDGAMEHASIASFARLSLELMTFGAPAELVDAAHAAARDEVRHARLAFAVASRFAGTPVSPGKLPVSCGPAASTLAELARDAFLDGCVSETVATLEALAARDAATDPPIRGVLAQIAEDEAVHATFAWRILGWAIAEGGPFVVTALTELTRALEEEAAAPSSLAPREAADPRLAAFGVLGAGARTRVRREALAEVVLPCAAVLLDIRGEGLRERPRAAH